MTSNKVAPITFKELPGWRLTVDEVSAGVYEVHGTDGAGRSVQVTGVDPAALLEQCKKRAAEVLRSE